MVGKLLGPEAVVPYACTGKLMTMLANQPQLFMQMALPALSELRGRRPRERLFEVSRSMTQLMLLASGAIVAHRARRQRPFVDWWVGGSRFGGTGLTALLLAGMLVRHVNVDDGLHALLLRPRAAAGAHQHRRRSGGAAR